MKPPYVVKRFSSREKKYLCFQICWIKKNMLQENKILANHSFKKLYFHGKWRNQFTHKSVSIFIICSNFIWMKNWIYITTFSEKFPNQCKEKTNSKVPSDFSHYSIQGLILIMVVKSMWKINLIRLSNLYAKFANLVFLL